MPITGAARIAGIMGWPIAHSRSPALHGFWLNEHGIDGAYVPLPIEPANFGSREYLMEQVRTVIESGLPEEKSTKTAAQVSE